MKQTIYYCFLIILMNMCEVKVFAHDIEVKNADGVNIYYVWTNNNTELAVSYRGNSYDSYAYEYEGIVTIPQSVEYNGSTYNVTSINSYAFCRCSNLTNVNIPNSVTSIGNDAFYDTKWYNNQPDGLIYAGRVAYKYKGAMPENTSIMIEEGTLGIAGSAFYGCSGLTSIAIPNSVTNIGNYAFSDCSGLTNFTIPNSVTNIGNYAFSDCSGLTSFTIPNSVTNIGNDAFRNCSGLTSITFHCNSIGSWFRGMTSIKNITIGDEVTSIGSYAFENCTRLMSAIIGAGVTSIDTDAFKGTSLKKTIWLTNTPPSGYSQAQGTINYVSNGSYTNLNNTIVYPFISSMFEVNGVKYVPVSLSERTCDVIDGTYDESLTNLKLSRTVWYSGIEMKVNKIMPYSFYNNTYINNLEFDFDNDYDYSGYDVTNDIETYTKRTYTWVWENPSKKWYVLNNLNEYEPYGVHADNMNTWYEGKLAIFNDHEWEYSNGSWNDLGLLIKANSSGDNYIERNSGNIGEIDLGVPITSETRVQIKHYPTKADGGGILWTAGIEWRIFFAGDYLYFDFQGTRKSIRKPINTLYEWEIGNYYIKDIHSSTNDIISGTPFESFSNTGNNIIFGPYGAEDFCRLYYIKIFEGENLVKDLVPYFDGNNYGLWDKVNNMAHMPTHGTVTGNVSVDIYPKYYAEKEKPYVVEMTIGDYAFSNCNNLKEVVVPDATSSIGANAFCDCSSLVLAKIGTGVREIGINAFSGCSSIHEIFIPKSVKTINDNVFKGCISLNTVIMEDKESELTLGSNGSSPLFADCPLDSVYIGRNITYPTSNEKGYSPFYRNTSLRSVMITDKETEISENEFYGCSNLKNVSIGDGVTTIGNWAFSGCSSLDYFAFGSSMKTIGKEAFSDCTAMTSLYSKAVTPPVCGSQTLDDINKWQCKLFVPNGCLSTYQGADQWKEFLFIEEGAMVEEKMGDANGDGIVNAKDIADIVNHTMGMPTSTGKFGEKAADMNKDGVVNIADIVQILNNIKGK